MKDTNLERALELIDELQKTILFITSKNFLIKAFEFRIVHILQEISKIIAISQIEQNKKKNFLVSINKCIDDFLLSVNKMPLITKEVQDYINSKISVCHDLENIICVKYWDTEKHPIIEKELEQWIVNIPGYIKTKEQANYFEKRQIAFIALFESTLDDYIPSTDKRKDLVSILVRKAFFPDDVFIKICEKEKFKIKQISKSLLLPVAAVAANFLRLQYEGYFKGTELDFENYELF